jgi:hypothetical protein
VHCPLHATVVADPQSAHYENSKGLRASLTLQQAYDDVYLAYKGRTPRFL